MGREVIKAGRRGRMKSIRGYACVPCHTRKKRCDGMRPSCSTCTRSRVRCEYAPPPSEPSSQGQVRALLARVDELENMLNALSSSRSSPTGSVQGLDTELVANVSASGLPVAISPVIDPASGEISDWLQGILITTMMAHRRRYSLYHNVSTLQSPPQPLLNAMNLVACHILTASAGPETQPTLQELESLKPVLLSKVYAGVRNSLENAQDLLAGAVCGPALAAQYLLEVGRFVEAHWLAGSAVRFAISSGIQTITRHQWAPGSTSDLNQSPLELSSSLLVPPRSTEEQRDRLMGWWLAYTADGLIEIVAGLPSTLRAEIFACLGDADANLTGSRAIPAVFPLPEGMHEAEPQGAEVSSISIIDLLCQDNALATLQDGSFGSVFAMRLKAITFYHVAVAINDSHRSGCRLLDHGMSSRIFSCISAFIEQLPSLSYRESPGSPHERGGFVNLEVVVAYMIAHTATIRLYATSMFVDDQQNRFNAALAIAHLAAALDGEEVQTQSQVLTTCCNDAFEVFNSDDNTQRTGTLEFQTLTSFIERLKVTHN